MLDVTLIGGRIKELRNQRGLTQKEFADILSVSFQAVSNWERGIAPPDIENLIKIAKYFGIMVDTLLSAREEELYLGVDGGGTKTEFTVVSSSGQVFGRIVRSASNPNDIGYEKAEDVICSGVKEILIEHPSLKSIFCGIAGTSTGNYAKKLEDALKKAFPTVKARVMSDAFNLFAIDDSADMAVISGTGSVVFAKHKEGYSRIGGWGYLFDDKGSAYDIGKDAIRHALTEEDCKKSPSLLHRMLLEKLNTPTVWDGINTLYKGGKPYIAELSSLVFEACKLNDELAIGIIDENLKALAEKLNTGVRLYNAKPIAVASGGLFEHHADIMKRHIKKYSDVKLLITDLPPVFGACRKACMLAGDISDGFCESFKRTYGEINQ